MNQLTILVVALGFLILYLYTRIKRIEIHLGFDPSSYLHGELPETQKTPPDPKAEGRGG